MDIAGDGAVAEADGRHAGLSSAAAPIRVPRLGARRTAAWLAIALLVFAYYLGLATQFAYEPWPATSGGFVFNSQLRALLAGRLDIDPGVIGNEGFVRDGKTYTYFGIWPALLRLPVATQLWRDWTTLSCVCAATLAALALLAASTANMRRTDPTLTRAILLALAASFVLSGPQVELLGKPSFYVEAVLWAYASACLFLYTALPLLFGGPVTRGRLAALAACAALALLARVSTGLALYAATSAFACALTWRRVEDPARCIRCLLPAALILLSAVLVTAAVNAGRWGNPLEFAPLALNHYYAAYPPRLERLASHGAFAPARIPDGLSYYAAPGWFLDAAPGSARATRVAKLFDEPEGPPLGIPQTQGLWLSLALIGAAALASSRTAIVFSTGVAAIATGLAVGPLLIASYHYLAFRYRAEFAPTILLFGLIGFHTLQGRLVLYAARLRALLLAFTLAASAAQILQAHAALRAYACTPLGSYVAARQAVLACLGAPSSRELDAAPPHVPSD